MLVPLLLLLISALVLACVVMYNHARQVESVSNARDEFFAEELRRAQEADILTLSPPPQAAPARPVPTPAAPWRDRALLLSIQGWEPRCIAREVGATIAEVELILALG